MGEGLVIFYFWVKCTQRDSNVQNGCDFALFWSSEDCILRWTIKMTYKHINYKMSSTKKKKKVLLQSLKKWMTVKKKKKF